MFYFFFLLLILFAFLKTVLTCLFAVPVVAVEQHEEVTMMSRIYKRQTLPPMMMPMSTPVAVV